MNILGIETSCDETAISVVKNGKEILSNVISTQIPIHRLYGGVVPEIASRNHTMSITTVYKEAMDKAGLTIRDIDAVAIANGPGLLGALLVGTTFAKTLAYANNIPLVALNHMDGHVASCYLADNNLKPPFLCLLVSGGHTQIVLVSDYNKHKVLGQTRDDACGEAFDKIARVLGLGYPGGPAIQKMAEKGEPNIEFPRGLLDDNSLDFSYSGLKSAVINYVHNSEQRTADRGQGSGNSGLKSADREQRTANSGKGQGANLSSKATEKTHRSSLNAYPLKKADVAASFQKAAIDILVIKTLRALEYVNQNGSKINTIAIAGGVSANAYLRASLGEICAQKGINLVMPPINLCTDNGAMIASAGYFHFVKGENIAGLDLTAYSN
ncbi:MAG: tRNA (adenosine(37)-N6)-threonylcarbamoyltransferase complex transferase subunit TsaD [Firmicutes bacterium]|nr:tRNA (adenosine(37)-N6)-threonylcarbamoyltransferase complex transferase subunit TsaD [Bacillota bacterium]